MVRRPFDDVRQSLLPRPLRASPTDAEYLSDMLCPLPRRTESVHDGYRVGALPRRASFPIHTAFPDLAPGRHPHCSFRGLLELYTRYGLPDCSPTFPWTSLARFRSAPLPVLTARQLSNLTINYSNGSLPHWYLAPLGHTQDHLPHITSYRVKIYV